MSFTQILSAALFALTIVAAPAIAQDQQNAKVLVPGGKRIELSSTSGILVRLPRSATTVFVADATIADVNVRSPRLIYLFGKQPGETTLYAIDKRERVILSQNISVAINLFQLRQNIQELYPNVPVKVSASGSKLVLTGPAPSVDAADQIKQLALSAVKGVVTNVVNRMTVNAPTQVNIRVKFAEVSRDINKRIGLNWEAFGNVTSDYAIGFAVGGDIVRDILGGFIVPNDEVDRVASTYNNGSVQIDTILDLLDDEGLITILAEPNLTAMSGKQAEFLAGGEFPIPVSSNDGVTTILYRQFGVSLAFTPTIVGENRINLQVRPEVSQLTSAGAVQANGFNIPALQVRRAQTTVEIGSGQSFALAGLLQNHVNQNLSDIPGIKDIPVLGALFRSDAYRRQETELMIVVTPYIVRPTSGRLTLPTDKFQPPKDMERFLLGRTHVQQPAQGPAAPLDPSGRPGLVGPAGFVLQ